MFIFSMLLLFIVAILGTVVLLLWQSDFGDYDNGDCITVMTAATVIAYLVAISMVIRWRWVRRVFSSVLYHFGIFLWNAYVSSLLNTV